MIKEAEATGETKNEREVGGQPPAASFKSHSPKQEIENQLLLRFARLNSESLSLPHLLDFIHLMELACVGRYIDPPKPLCVTRGKQERETVRYCSKTVDKQLNERNTLTFLSRCLLRATSIRKSATARVANTRYSGLKHTVRLALLRGNVPSMRLLKNARSSQPSYPPRWITIKPASGLMEEPLIKLVSTVPREGIQVGPRPFCKPLSMLAPRCPPRRFDSARPSDLRLRSRT